jgi:Tetratricopeptide repeat
VSPTDLPADDHELEELMRRHLEPVTPSSDLRDRTLDAIQARLQPSGPHGDPAPDLSSGWGLSGPLLGAALLAGALAVGWTAARDAERPGALPPGETPASPAPADEQQPLPDPTALVGDPLGTPIDDPIEDPPPAPPEPREPLELLEIRLGPGPAPEFEADYDYNQLHVLFEADLVVSGRMGALAGDGSVTLTVDEVLRGEREELLAIQAGEGYTGCEGVPDFAGYAGLEVCLFLRRAADGTLTPLHGGSGIQRLPYGGLLDAEALGALVRGEPLPAPTLVALVEAGGPRAVGWLASQLNRADGFGADHPAVQTVLADALPTALREGLRRDVMAILRVLRPADGELSAPLLASLRAYHESFLADPLNSWVGPGPNAYSNSVADHVAYLEFLRPFDPAWVTEQVDRTLGAIEAGSHPAARATNYMGLAQAAIEALDEAIRRDPTDAEAWARRGAAKLKLGDLQGAIADLDQALRLDPASGFAWAFRGAARAKRGDDAGAIADFQRAIELDPQAFWAPQTREQLRQARARLGLAAPE